MKRRGLHEMKCPQCPRKFQGRLHQVYCSHRCTAAATRPVLTQDQRRAAADAYLAGANCRQLSKKYRCNEETVRLLLDKLGIERRHRGWRYPIGARRPDGRGYVLVKEATPDGYSSWKPEHVIVAEKKIGRPLKKNEHAHHENEKRNDNRPRNIEVLTRSEHGRHHHAPPQKTVRAAQRAYRDGLPVRQIVADFGISTATLYRSIKPNRTGDARKNKRF